MACPAPLLACKNALRSHPLSCTIRVLADCPEAPTVLRLWAQGAGLSFKCVVLRSHWCIELRRYRKCTNESPGSMRTSQPTFPLDTRAADPED